MVATKLTAVSTVAMSLIARLIVPCPVYSTACVAALLRLFTTKGPGSLSNTVVRQWDKRHYAGAQNVSGGVRESDVIYLEKRELNEMTKGQTAVKQVRSSDVI